MIFGWFTIGLTLLPSGLTLGGLVLTPVASAVARACDATQYIARRGIGLEKLVMQLRGRSDNWQARVALAADTEGRV